MTEETMSTGEGNADNTVVNPQEGEATESEGQTADDFTELEGQTDSSKAYDPLAQPVETSDEPGEPTPSLDPLAEPVETTEPTEAPAE